MLRDKKFFLIISIFFAGILSVNTISKSCGGFFDADQDLVSSQKNAVVLFDFDGTLADSFLSSIEVANQLALEYNFPPLTEEKIATIKNVPLKDVLLKHYDIPWYKIPMIVFRGKELMSDQKYADKLRPFEGMHEAIVHISRYNINLGILTSSREDRVRHFIDKHNFKFFQTVYADSSLFGKHKCLQRFLDNHGLRAQDVIYVGDEVRDIEAAHKVGMRSIAVSWGYNSRDVLLAANPHVLVQTPADMAEQIIKLAYHRA